jgi:hypothetical protein
MELGPEKIRVNTLCPGLIAGDRCDAVVKLTADAPGVAESAVRATWQAQNMMRSFLDAEDIAAYVSFLVSDDARFVTNQNICVDAGTTSLDNLDDYEALVPKARRGPVRGRVRHGAAGGANTSMIGGVRGRARRGGRRCGRRRPGAQETLRAPTMP